MEFRTTGKGTLALKIKKQNFGHNYHEQTWDTKNLRKLGVSCIHIIYTDEKFSFNELLVKSRPAFVSENVFIIVKKSLKENILRYNYW